MDSTNNDSAKLDITTVFVACMHCLGAAVHSMKNEEHPHLLKLSLLRLRLSRIGEASINPNSVPSCTTTDTQDKAKDKLSELLKLLAHDEMGNISEHPQRLAERYSVSKQDEILKQMLEKMNQIATARSFVNEQVPIPPHLEQYKGCITWTETEYEKAAGIMGSLESVLGSRKLRHLSNEEHEKMLSDKLEGGVGNSYWGTALSSTANQLDPLTGGWVSEIIEQQQQRGKFHTRIVGNNIGGGAFFMNGTVSSEDRVSHHGLEWLQKLGVPRLSKEK